MLKLVNGLTADEYMNGFCKDELAVKHYEERIEKLINEKRRLIEALDDFETVTRRKDKLKLNTYTKDTIKDKETWYE